jgi:hypothetical protein
MNVGVAFISDRPFDLYLSGCVESWAKYGRDLPCHVVDDRDHHLGMAGAVRAAWDWALDSGFDYLFHLEEDFRFTAPVPLFAMRLWLDAHPLVAQVLLKRQPWSPEEVAVGGFVELNPDAYAERDGMTLHRQFFSLNPCLIPRDVLMLGWPDGNEAEFTRICVDRGYSFAIYGAKADPPLVEHVGHERGVGWRL